MRLRAHTDAVQIAKDVLFWRQAAARNVHDRQLQRRCRRHARNAETRLVDLAIGLEARLRREGVQSGTSPVLKNSGETLMGRIAIGRTMAAP